MTVMETYLKAIVAKDVQRVTNKMLARVIKGFCKEISKEELTKSLQSRQSTPIKEEETHSPLPADQQADLAPELP